MLNYQKAHWRMIFIFRAVVTGRQTDRETARKTERQPDKQTDSQTNRQTAIEFCRRLIDLIFDIGDM